MGDYQRTPNLDFYSILGIPKSATIKEMCKAYKSLVSLWHPDKNPSNKDEAQAKFQQINEAYKALNDKKLQEGPIRIAYEPKTPPSKDFSSPVHSSHHYKNMDDSIFSNPSMFFLNVNKKIKPTSPTPIPLSKNASRRSTSPAQDHTRSKSTGRCSLSRTPSPNPSKHSSKNSSLSNSPTTRDKSTRKGRSRRSNSETEFPDLSRNGAKKSNTVPIVYSQSTAWKIPPPVERKLECTFEELCYGCVKKINIFRAIIHNGIINHVEETLKIKVKPGWRKGTKIKFEGKGDEKPGYLSADIIFLIDEKSHPLFRRDGDDLEYGVEIPLIQALTGCSISVPLLGGEQMSLSFDEIIFPGFEKVIPGQGMPTKNEGRRGHLRIKFFVEFPLDLSRNQRIQACNILKDCS